MTDEKQLDVTPAEETPEPTGAEAVEIPTAVAEEPAVAPETEPESKPTKLRQIVDITDVGPCKKHIKVTVEREDIDDRFNEEYSKLLFESPVAGFRPGKVPRKVVERRFRKEVTQQVKGQVLMASLEQLAAEHELSPLNTPDIDPDKIDIPEQGPLIYEFDVEVRPEFDLPEYKGLKFKRPVWNITEEDIDREEKRLLAPYGQMVPKGGDQPIVEMDDYLIADVVTEYQGRRMGELKEVSLHVEPRLAFKDGVAEQFAERVIGATVGDQRTIDIRMSDQVADPALRGVTIQASLTIQDIKTLRMPEITHELMHEFHVHSREQLRELIRVVLQRRLEYYQRESARLQFLEHVLTHSNWDLPEDLVKRQARSTFARKVMDMRAAGMSEEQIKARERMLSQDVLRNTTLSLKQFFVLQKVAEVENIEINEDDLNDEIERLAAQHNESPRRLRARLERENMLEAMAADLLERKALDLVLENAEFEDEAAGANVEDERIATVEEQAIPGEMKDLAAEEEGQPSADESTASEAPPTTPS
ncbi:MAG: trigger factor [Gemmataceae bacterium]